MGGCYQYTGWSSHADTIWHYEHAIPDNWKVGAWTAGATEYIRYVSAVDYAVPIWMARVTNTRPHPTTIPNRVQIHLAVLPGCRMRNDRQTDRLWCVAEHCGMPWNVAEHLHKVAERLWSIVVHCRNVAEGLQTIVVLYNACSASSALCGGVHHILSPHNSGNVTESLRTTGSFADHCSALRCTTVHYGALWKPC